LDNLDQLDDQLRELFNKKTWTEQECLWFLDLLRQKPVNEFQDIFSENYISSLSKIKPADPERASRLLQMIHEKAGIVSPIVEPEPIETPVRKIPVFRRIAVAAAVLILFGGGYYYYNYSKNHSQSTNPTETNNQVATIPTDIAAPKNNRATITLASGQKIFLDSAANGLLATQGSTNIKKIANGQLSYVNASALTSGRVGGDIYNTLFNPRGSKVIDITLADGTQVWLNAESSIKYPVAFSGNAREVEITGEAYFEVKHDAAKPFMVKTKNSIIQDIGTRFNVNAYQDQTAEKTTLIQGAIEVSATAGTETARQRRLSPGEQALVQAGDITLNEKTDLVEVLAWKNGLFDFHNADIKAIMQQLARWYDLQVTYEGKTTSETYSGKIGRTLSLKDVMDGLAFTHVKYRIEDGRKLVILP
jgi:transmembrane sensor